MNRILSIATYSCCFAGILGVAVHSAHAGEDKSGVKPQVISLPSGPGSIEGLGESFEPQLNSGTTTYAIKLKVQPGRAGFQPDLALSYNGGGSNGCLGLGWALSDMYIQRQTDKGLPSYDDTDTYVENGGEELVHVGDGIFRHENEGAFTRYQVSDASGEPTGDVSNFVGWIAHNRSGVRHTYGLGTSSQIQKGGKVYRWLLQEKVDTNGNTIRYEYDTFGDNPQQYCTRIVFSEHESNYHEILFEYDERPDVLPDYRPTFRLENAYRCTSISMKTLDSLVRRYDFAYVEDCALTFLESVTQVGSDGVSTLPPATFTYTQFDPDNARIFPIEGAVGSSAPPFLILSAEPDATLNDMNADGLPDLLHAEAGEHKFYLNQGLGTDGKHRWGPLEEMPDSPGEALGNDGASLADINGDGKTDFIARRSASTYFIWPNLGNGQWGAVETFADDSNLAFDFENPTVRLLDVNNDKHIDVMYTHDSSAAEYSYFLNDGGAGFKTVVYETGPGGALTFDQQPGMKLADMNGDRLQDIVLLQDGLLTYWPSTGVGQWDLTRYGTWGVNEAGTGTRMSNPPDSDDISSLYLDSILPDLVDLNGDGLTDIFYAPEGTPTVYFWLNCDSMRFEGPYTINNVPVRLADTSVQPGDLNGNGTTDILWNDPEGSFGNSQKFWQYLEFCPDEKPYLLKSVTNGMGKTITFSYSTSTQEYLRDEEERPWPQGVPNAINVLAGFEVHDGLNAYYTELTYHDGYYDGEDKEFRGFAAAEKREIGDASAPDLISAFTFDIGIEEESLKGKPLNMEAQDANDDVFYREEFEWTARKLLDGSNGDTRTVTYAYQQAKTRDVLEKGNGTPVQLQWEYEHDDYGNTTRQTEHGRMDTGWDDERVIVSTFTAASDSGLSNWILDKPVESRTEDENGVLYASQRNYYDKLALGDISKANLSMTEDWVKDSKWITSVRNDHDTYGNVVATYDPLYGIEAGHYRELSFDDAFQTFPVEEHIHTGALTLLMTATYDAGFGVVATSTEYNGHTTTSGYDAFGRLIFTTQPLDSSTTVEYDYILAHDLGGGKLINWVETRQRESDGGGTVDARTFYDGLGRAIMTRSEGEFPGQVVVSDTVQFNARKTPWKYYLPYFEENSTLDFVDPTYHTGFTEHHYDAQGREVMMIQPDESFSQVHYGPLVKTQSDEEQSNPDSIHYGNGMRYVEDGLQDEDGKGRLREVYEIVSLNDDGTAGPLTEWKTAYSYDILGNFTGYVDAQNNQKILEFDGLSRKTFMNDPDRGHMNYVYNDASKLIRTTDAKQQVIRYEYDGVNRLAAEYYGAEKADPDVTYHYDVAAGPVDRGAIWSSYDTQSVAQAVLQGDTSTQGLDANTDGKLDVADVVTVAQGDQGASSSVTAQNSLGYLAWVEDLSGEEHNSYDARGRVEWVVKRIIDSGPDDLKNFYTGMDYDSMDRVATLTYPDQSFVSYTYNTRGLLESVPQVIDRYDYNPAGQNLELALANGVTTTYDYDIRLRLDRLHSLRARDERSLQDLNYTYDTVSNITAIDDGRSTAALDAIGAELGIGAAEARRFQTTQNFSYDALYRLTQATNSTVYGTIDYRYDRIGNMVHKTAQLQDADPLMDLGAMQYGGATGTAGRVGRAPGDAPGPHAITATARGLNGNPMIYNYDDNGNMTTNRGMQLQWDYKDRIAGLSEGSKSAAYRYDYTNARKKKIVSDSGDAGNDEAVYYIDQFSEVRRDNQLTKYIYGGRSRVARSDGVATPSRGLSPSSFALHNHLGSTALRLSATGNVINQQVNHPFGHRRKERSVVGGPARANYHYTGKERDAESSLQYFEARYYDPVIAGFVSVDPLWERVGSSGDSSIEMTEGDELKRLETLVELPQQLNIYGYALKKPVGNIDPDGEFFITSAVLLGAVVGYAIDEKYGDRIREGTAKIRSYVKDKITSAKEWAETKYDEAIDAVDIDKKFGYGGENGADEGGGKYYFQDPVTDVVTESDDNGNSREVSKEEFNETKY